MAFTDHTTIPLTQYMLWGNITPQAPPQGNQQNAPLVYILKKKFPNNMENIERLSPLELSIYAWTTSKNEEAYM